MTYLQKFINSLTTEIAVDLGTANTLIFVRGREIVLEEPSVIAVSTETHKPIAVGDQAKLMLGRAPGNIRVVRPLRDGKISDPETANLMLQCFLRDIKAAKPWVGRKPTILICIPSESNGIERRAIEEAGLAVGARQVHLIEEPLAAGIGAGLPVLEPKGSMVVDIGGGTTDVAVISLGNIVASKSLTIAGDAFDGAIQDFVRMNHSAKIGESTAEHIKKTLGSVALEDQEDLHMELRAQDVSAAKPAIIELKSSDLKPALTSKAIEICTAVQQTMETCPPELASDIAATGLMLTGGGALLRGLNEMITDKTGLHVTIAEDPLRCVARGCATALEKNIPSMYLQSRTT